MFELTASAAVVGGLVWGSVSRQDGRLQLCSGPAAVRWSSGSREACQHRAGPRGAGGVPAPGFVAGHLGEQSSEVSAFTASVGGHGACCVFAGLPAGWGLRPCGKVEPRECGVLRVPAACGHWGDHAPLEEQLCSRPVPVCGGQTGLTAEMVQCDTCPQGEADPASPGRRGAPGI